MPSIWASEPIARNSGHGHHSGWRERTGSRGDFQQRQQAACKVKSNVTQRFRTNRGRGFQRHFRKKGLLTAESWPSPVTDHGPIPNCYLPREGQALQCAIQMGPPNMLPLPYSEQILCSFQGGCTVSLSGTVLILSPFPHSL